MYFKFILSSLVFCLATNFNYAQVGIGTTNPDNSAILDVYSDSQGFLPPRMTEVQRDLIKTPVEGLVVYCIDCCSDGRLSFYSTQWNVIPTCNSVPVITNPTVTGTLEEGEIVTASYTYTDSENDAEGTHTFQWYRADDALDLNRIAIPGATDSNYTLTADDVSKYVQYTIIPTALTGTSPGAIDTSTYSALVSPAPPSVIVIPEGNFTSGGNGGGAAQHEADVNYPTLFNGDTVTDNNRFHEGDYIDITFSTPGNPVLLPSGCIVKIYWFHNGDNNSWGVYTTFFNENTTINTVNDGPISGIVSERVFVATTTSEFNKIRVGAISTGVGGYDARIREIDVIKPDGTEITIIVTAPF